MKKTTKGAWLINHTNRLGDVKGSYEFEDIELAGKCGVFLSNLAASNEQSDLSIEKVDAIAKVSNIKKTEIETIKTILENAELIQTASNGSLSVLGITTSSVLSHTSDIFENSQPSNFQRAALELSDNISDLPKEEKLLTEYISDIYTLPNHETKNLFGQAEEIGFVDYETLDDGTKLYFNGNLFRREVAKKTSAVIASLKPDDRNRMSTLDELLIAEGCVTIEMGTQVLGENLLSKLQSIGMYDFNQVSNSTESKIIITKPSAFSKYGNPFEEDALDLAKAFVSSLYYGMNFSEYSRGKISMLQALLRKLVNGQEVGPATAIGEDYRLLELKRVVQLRRDTKYPNRYYMRLLKIDIGVLAMQVLEFGEAAESAVLGSAMSLGSVTNYQGPENIRQITRKKQATHTKEDVGLTLRTFRS
ncbi:hypothetical protein [Sphingobacterium multivorum]|uniref:hypothetical protein n=1 Tax=Sphingobacterium multivorum TaxID=28454 RepID=UPI0028A71A9D|nr:hypothetical protein [Sphingobacterium multivorum]